MFSNYETSLKYYFKALDLTQANHYNSRNNKMHFRIAWGFITYWNKTNYQKSFCRKIALDESSNNIISFFEESLCV